MTSRLWSALLPMCGLGLACVAWWAASRHLPNASLSARQDFHRVGAAAVRAPPATNAIPAETHGTADLARLALRSVRRLARGFLLGIVLAAPAGFALGRAPRLTRVAEPILRSWQPLAPLWWAPLALLVCGGAEPTALCAGAAATVWPVLFSTMQGVRAIRPEYWTVARVLELSRRTTFASVVLPAALPHVIAGCRQGVGIAWIVVVVAEMLTGAPGVGGQLWPRADAAARAGMLPALLAIGVVGITLDRMMRLAETHVTHADAVAAHR